MSTKHIDCVAQALYEAAELEQYFLNKPVPPGGWHGASEHIRDGWRRGAKVAIAAFSKTPCVWIPILENFWRTECSGEFSFDNLDGLKANDYAYCPKCGRPIKEN